jgi:predicted MPP superfamily phosphohydrolase
VTAWPVRAVLLVALAAAAVPVPFATRPAAAADRGALALPLEEGSARFAVIGDSGTGDAAQFELARRLEEWRAVFPFELVVMLGDNIYGKDDARDYRRKFEEPYKALLDAGVKFYAALGNHDDPKQRFYEKFNMGGERYYSFKAPQGKVRFFALDSNYLDKPQLEWLEKQLDASGEDWKICFFHHPLYSSGKKHGPAEELREVLEPVLLKHGVDVVLQGHEHFYERIEPQQGIHYFISGAGGQLRRANIGKSDITARGYDQDLHFMLVEIADDAMHFQTISRAGATVDKGTIERPREPPRRQ